MAQDLDSRIWRLLRSLRSSVFESKHAWKAHDMRYSTEESTGLPLTEAKNVARPGVTAPLEERILPISGEMYEAMLCKVANINVFEGFLISQTKSKIKI